MFQTPRPAALALLGSFAAAGLCGCGGTDLAATEDVHPAVVSQAEAAETKSKPAAPLDKSASNAGVTPVSPVKPVEPDGWDFFGPPITTDAEQDAGPAAEHLRLNGFIQLEGEPQKAILAMDRDDRPAEILSLSVGETRHGVTLVELSAEQGTATVEHPGRVVLKLGRGGGTAATSGSGRPASRPASFGKVLPRRSSPVPYLARPAVPSDRSPRSVPPPPPPPPTPILTSSRCDEDDCDDD